MFKKLHHIVSKYRLKSKLTVELTDYQSSLMKVLAVSPIVPARSRPVSPGPVVEGVFDSKAERYRINYTNNQWVSNGEQINPIRENNFLTEQASITTKFDHLEGHIGALFSDGIQCDSKQFNLSKVTISAKQLTHIGGADSASHNGKVSGNATLDLRFEHTQEDGMVVRKTITGLFFLTDKEVPGLDPSLKVSHNEKEYSIVLSLRKISIP